MKSTNLIILFMYKEKYAITWLSSISFAWKRISSTSTSNMDTAFPHSEIFLSIHFRRNPDRFICQYITSLPKETSILNNPFLRAMFMVLKEKHNGEKIICWIWRFFLSYYRFTLVDSIFSYSCLFVFLKNTFSFISLHQLTFYSLHFHKFSSKLSTSRRL